MKEICIGQVLCCEEDAIDISQYSFFDFKRSTYSSFKAAEEDFDKFKYSFQNFYKKHLPRLKCVSVFYFFDGYDYFMLKKAISNSLGVLEYEEETGYLLEELTKEEEQCDY